MSSKVYFIPASGEESPKLISEKTDKLFLELGLNDKIEKGYFVGLKIHFGEKGNKGYIKPPWLLSMISSIKKKTSRVFMTDTNTLYIGHRSNSIDHLNLAWGHGFSQAALGIPILIADGLIGRDYGEIEANLFRINSAKIGSAFINSDMLLCLSHFTGHMLTGFGAALKNLGMGCASRAGKLEQHSDVHPRVNADLCTNCSTCINYCPTGALIQKGDSAFILEEKCIGCGECLVVCSVGAIRLSWDEDTRRIQEKMTEYAYCAWKNFEGKIGFINFLINVTRNCDCMAKEEPAVIEDIGILSSLNPVAIDQASVDLIEKRNTKGLSRITHNVDWSIQIKHGERIGLGSTDYELVEVD